MAGGFPSITRSGGIFSEGGLDYACYITTAQEYDGSLSGAQVREAVSWGKVKPRARQVTLIAEATTVLPFVASYAITKLRKLGS